MGPGVWRKLESNIIIYRYTVLQFLAYSTLPVVLLIVIVFVSHKRRR